MWAIDSSISRFQLHRSARFDRWYRFALVSREIVGHRPNIYQILAEYKFLFTYHCRVSMLRAREIPALWTPSRLNAYFGKITVVSSLPFNPPFVERWSILAVTNFWERIRSKRVFDSLLLNFNALINYPTAKCEREMAQFRFAINGIKMGTIFVSRVFFFRFGKTLAKDL